MLLSKSLGAYSRKKHRDNLLMQIYHEWYITGRSANIICKNAPAIEIF